MCLQVSLKGVIMKLKLLYRSSTLSGHLYLCSQGRISGSRTKYKQSHTSSTYTYMIRSLYGYTHICTCLHIYYLWSAHLHSHLDTHARTYIHTYKYSHLLMCPHICTYILLILYTNTQVSI